MKWYRTKVTEILGVKFPILQGPFGGGISSAKLVSIVSNLGGLGGYGAYHLQPEEITEIIREIRQKTQKPFNINLWVNDADEQVVDYTEKDYERLKNRFKPYFDELNVPIPKMPDKVQSKFERQVEVLLREKPPVFSFIFGIPPKEILSESRKRGIVTIGTATTLDEALALDTSETDLIIVSGFEAGGHRPSFIHNSYDSLTGTMALIPMVKDQVKKPVIAAGGMADGRGIAAAFTLGASGVQIGTAFLACEESNASAHHKDLLFSTKSRHTVLTKAFTGRLARGIKSSISQNMRDHERELAPLPLQSLFLNPLRQAAIEQNRTEMITFWSGQIAPILKHTKAEELMNSLIEGTSEILKRQA